MNLYFSRKFLEEKVKMKWIYAGKKATSLPVSKNVSFKVELGYKYYKIFKDSG